MNRDASRRAALAGILLAAAWFVCGAELQPAFRLAAGGRPLAAPILDAQGGVPAVWYLSEDKNLYLLSETGKLILTAPLPEGGRPFLGVDAFGRALLFVEDSGGRRRRILGFTRSGKEAFSADLGSFGLGMKTPLGPAIGSDGRLVFGYGDSLICFSQAGTRLWEQRLPAALALPPAVDGSGRFTVGLADDSVLVLSPYGQELGRNRLGSRARSVAALTGGGSAVGLENGELVFLSSTAGILKRTPISGKPIVALCPAGASLPLVATAGPARTGGDSIPDASGAFALLYGIDEAGLAFALGVEALVLWKTETGVARGMLQSFEQGIGLSGPGKAAVLSHAGQLLREALIRNAALPGLFSPEGLLFSPGADWILAAYRFGSALGGQRRVSPPPYGRNEAAVETLKLFYDDITEADRQLSILADIEKRVDSGRIGADEGPDTAVAAAVALGKFDEMHPPEIRMFRGNPLPRARACGILGKLGSPESRDVLADVVRSNADPSIRSAALDAMAAIAVDPEGNSGRAFLDALTRGQVDEQVALSMAAAVEAMALRSGLTPSQDSIRALLILASPPYGRGVRDRASRTLGRIAGTIGS